MKLSPVILPVITPVLTSLCLVTACGGSSSGGSNDTQNTTTPPADSTPPSTPTPAPNNAPVANAGENQSIILGNTVSLSGAQSADSDGDSLSYLWTMSNAPDGSTVSLTNPENVNTSFTPDIAGDYVISLTVSDSELEHTASVTVAVSPLSAENQTPIADAGTNQSANVSEAVLISGENSRDPDGDSLAYQWAFTNKPKGSQVALSQAQSVAASFEFTPDASGDYALQLTVSDGESTSSPVSITITAQSNNLDITDKIFVEQSGSCAEYLGTYQSSVDDIKRGLAFNGSVSISADSSECLIQVNQIPNHDFNDQSARFANDVQAVLSSYRIPIKPEPSATPANLVIGTTEAIMLNGVTLDILAAACYGVGDEPLGREKIGCGANQNDNPWRYDPMSPLNTFGTDIHNAHTQPNGKYHYHANPVAMFSQTCTAGIASPVIGFAADGYPIFGSCFIDSTTGETRKALSSYQLKDNGGPRQAVDGFQTPQAGVGDIASNNYDGQFRGDWEYVQGAGDLDQCNGMVVDGQYGYFITDSFPWVINCYTGEVNSSFSRSVELERRSHSHSVSHDFSHDEMHENSIEHEH
ncbi:YHYH protein [Thalassotalea euphylliae]|uniref:YHYH protein n=1 Tax=Thalassotalea euphylliae TaxID=1655234 RepID=A0A3E0TTT6_9GAMM|nr:YHYH protein [Thalassotalea euphylliae]REL27813.1 YHYH protein [Thalassotalea euphylliae]